ncbi:DUF1850 domain-containing protein [Paenibacillus sp. V4I7]|uniref:DUF1850 domain-containing protein n=1 Tax=Paenibacillus sp. V4I7 TaxID=3042307 RepID=UPI002789DD08|nr:DUF1850 domain-containing protein [Paenibacillus sp. V4I7]MDQ0902315.1 hypothetical protein [Paenibacillus sp. V4I7]
MMYLTPRVWERAPAPVFLRIWLWLIIFVTVVAVAIWLWASTIPALTIRQVADGEVVFQSRMEKNGRFSLTYIHSIHRTPIEERFFINEKRQMVLDSMIFESYGVGIPSSLEGNETFRMENGKMRIENIHRTLEMFELRIGQVIADHKLLLRDQVIPLSQLSMPGSAVRFEISSLNIWVYLKGVLHFGR